MKHLIWIPVCVTLGLVAGCASDQPEPAAEVVPTPTVAKAPLPNWPFTPDMLFPADGSLLRPEDGEVLPDGRLIVADQIAGLRLISADGSSRPFGRFAEAGYQHEPPDIIGGPNGVTIEPSGTHLLVADVYRGGLYRVDTATEETTLIYQHSYGINVARGDRNGGIWFTQSSQNTPERGEEELFQSLDMPTPDGALYYLPPFDGSEGTLPVPVAEGLVFANGIVLDEERGYLYVGETMGGVVRRYQVDIEAGQISEPTVVLEGFSPDNLELDRDNRLWITSPLLSEVIVLDLDTGTTNSVFRISTPESLSVIAEAETRLAEGRSWLELFAPPLWAPGPGPTTGVILSEEAGVVFVSGLGNALIQLEF